MKARLLLQVSAAAVWLSLGVGCNQQNNQPVPAPEPQKLPPPEPAQRSVDATPPTLAANDALLDAAKTPAAIPISTLAETAAADTAKAAALPVAGTPPAAVASDAPSLAALSQDQVVLGLQQALSKGLQEAIATLGHNGGFLTNLPVRIPLPEKLQKVEAALRAVHQEKLADEFVATMNHAAEQAVPEAGAVFADSLKQMTIQDAKSILAGPPDAATRYFEKTTQTNLYARFYPIVQKATRQTGVTAAYQKFVEKSDLANLPGKLGALGNLVGGALADKEALDLDAYVTGKAMDGLFKTIADEEKRIRQNPVARTTDLLQKVFGALRN